VPSLAKGLSDMTEILFASHNANKLAEVRTLLAPLDIKILAPKEVGMASDFDVAETGATFAENAELKARAFAAQLPPAKDSDLGILADDSGVMVDALNGLPGVQSKRFVAGNDHDRNQAVLQRLAKIGEQTVGNLTAGSQNGRGAHYETVFCLLRVGSLEKHLFKGEMYGQIGLAEKGTAGFGYDAIFIPTGYTQTLGELGVEIKNKISHRARAAAKLLVFLAEK
jgi:XTP/dITP diphosphohydrolase